MAETAPSNTDIKTALIGAVETPNSAEIVPAEAPYLRHAIAVTEKHGLQKVEINDHDHFPNPYRTKGQRTVSELLSLLDEFSRRPLTPGEATLWGDYTTGTVTAVYNEHTQETAGWRDDLLTLKLAADPDWAAWSKISGEWFGQEEFGDLVEELLHTVIVPDQADLYEIINSVRATSSANFESRIDRSLGAQELTYTEEVTASAGKSTGKIEVPKTITLRLRPWEGHIDTYDLEAWFRLRVRGGSLALSIKLKPTQQTLRRAWGDMVLKIVEQTTIPVLAYRGTR